MGGPTACGEGDITALGQQPGSMVIGVGWGSRGGCPGHRKEWPWEEIAQAGWDLPGRPRWTVGGRERGFLPTQLPPHCAEDGGSRESGGAPGLN